MKRIIYQILTGTTGTTTYQIPIFLESSVDEMGIMVGFDGTVEQMEQFCNFTYYASGLTLTIYNSVNTNRIRSLGDASFKISWGDNTTTTISMPKISDTNLPLATHTYAVGTYEIEISVISPWKTDKIKRELVFPYTLYAFPTDFGTLTFTIPYSTGMTQTQTYLEDYRTLTGETNGTLVSFLGMGKSRIDEKKKYGRSNTYTGLTITATYTGYTIDGLFYMDYPDGYTHITGDTSLYYTDEIYQGMITRNEHLIGFIDLPQISSDIFIERGKQGVMERNLRLGEIDSTGELDIYGNGFFNVQKQ